MKKHKYDLLLFEILCILLIIFSIINPKAFLSRDVFQTMAFQLPEFSILALSAMVILTTGGINLSITSISALSGIIASFALVNLWTNNYGLVVSLVVTIIIVFIISLACGIINGFSVAYLGISPILATLATMMLFEGTSLLFTKGGTISGFPDEYLYIGNGTFLGIPVPLIIFIIVIFVTIILLEHSTLGFKVQMIGYNSTASQLSGINVKKVLVKAYVFSAFLCGISSILITSRYNSAKVDYGSSYLIQSIAAAVLGGAMISGRHRNVIGTVIAAAIIQVLSTGLNISGLNRFIIDILIGFILILVKALDYYRIKHNENLNTIKKN